jgi:hypothetical protein
MKDLLNRLSQYGFNQRILTEEDFFSIADEQGIVVVENTAFTAYLLIDGEAFICLAKDLNSKPTRKKFAMFHELCHHFNHGGIEPNEIHFFSTQPTKEEREAQAVGLIALCPVGCLTGEIEFDKEWRGECGTRVYDARAEIYDTYGI